MNYVGPVKMELHFFTNWIISPFKIDTKEKT